MTGPHTRRTTRAAILLLLFMLLVSAQRARIPRADPEVRSELRETFFSSLLEEDRTLSISLPPGYESTASGDFPVLFVLDAESRKGWSDCISTVERLHAAGTAPQMIAVGIWNTVRNRDMIPVAVSHRPGSGGSRPFLDFLTQELIPHIKRVYRASDFCVLYGASNSGLFTVYALLERPEAFRAYLASSPMLGHCPDFIQKKADAFTLRTRLLDRSLYMVYGTEDSARVTEFVPAFQDFLESNAPQGFVSRLDILEGEGHVPESSLFRGLTYVFTREGSPPAWEKRPR